MKRFLLFFLILSGLLLFLAVDRDYTAPAIALARQQEESPGQMLYQSRHSLRDDMGSPWQVVLFKRVKDKKVEELSLRLVGFPQEIQFQHPEALDLSSPKLMY
jgi:hypothetical protein